VSPEHGPLLCRSLADRADDDKACRNADARVQHDVGLKLEFLDRADHRQPGANGTLRVVFMRRRIAETDQDAVADQARDRSAEMLHFRRHGPVIGRDQRAKILRIEPRGERRRANEIAEHNGHLPALDRFQRTRR
jgi:hypothetical protein